MPRSLRQSIARRLLVAAGILLTVATTACRDDPTAPAATDVTPNAVMMGDPTEPVIGPVTLTLRVENQFFQSVPDNGFSMGLWGVEVKGLKVRFATLTSSNMVATSKDVPDNSAEDLDKRVGWFKVVLPKAGKTAKATLLAADHPFTVQGVLPRTQLLESETQHLGKLIVNRIPIFSVAAVENGAGFTTPVTFMLTGPDGFSYKVTDTGFAKYVPKPGLYTLCQTTAAPGYRLPSPACYTVDAKWSYSYLYNLKQVKL